MIRNVVCQEVKVLDKDDRDFLFVVENEVYCFTADYLAQVLKGEKITIEVGDCLFVVDFTPEQRRMFAAFRN
jgi:hypothetical protein